MGLKKQDESEKVAGDKYESTVDRAATGGPGRKPGQAEPEESEELEIDEDDDESEDTDEE